MEIQDRKVSNVGETIIILESVQIRHILECSRMDNIWENSVAEERPI